MFICERKAPCYKTFPRSGFRENFQTFLSCDAHGVNTRYMVLMRIISEIRDLGEIKYQNESAIN